MSKKFGVKAIALLVTASLLLAACDSGTSGGATNEATGSATQVVSSVATPTTASVLPTATSVPVAAQVPPTDTAVPPTDAAVPATDTALPPTDTVVPPADTVVPPTNTPKPKPTSTPKPKPTKTPKPKPTSTAVPPTNTAVPPPTDTPIQAAAPSGYRSSLANRGPAPEIHSDTWINSGPLTSADLRGHVVIVEFWTFLCYNCNNALPGLKAVYNKYHDSGLIVIGVHSPEFSSERDISNVRSAVQEKGIAWPVPIDNEFKNWGAYKNAYWPAFYIIDKRGDIRSVRIGEGNDAGLMSDVADLLQE